MSDDFSSSLLAKIKNLDVSRHNVLSILFLVYQELDREVSRLRYLHADRILCRPECCSCCVDDIHVFEVEALNIRHHCGKLLREAPPHPVGACVFLDEAGACRIYEHRPYVCRTQGLPLRWLEEKPGAEPVELRDICPLNASGDPIESLPPEACWTIGPFEGALASLQARIDQGKRLRLPLRSLMGESGHRSFSGKRPDL